MHIFMAMSFPETKTKLLRNSPGLAERPIAGGYRTAQIDKPVKKGKLYERRR
jgi:hypothetical protein